MVLNSPDLFHYFDSKHEPYLFQFIDSETHQNYGNVIVQNVNCEYAATAL